MSLEDRDKTNFSKIERVETKGNSAFTVVSNCSDKEVWRYFNSGKCSKVYGAHVSSDLCARLRESYINYRKSASDRKNYNHAIELGRIIKIGRKEKFSGNKGFVLCLVQRDGGEYNIKRYEVVNRKLVSSEQLANNKDSKSS